MCRLSGDTAPGGTGFAMSSALRGILGPGHQRTTSVSFQRAVLLFDYNHFIFSNVFPPFLIRGCLNSKQLRCENLHVILGLESE